MKIKFILIIMLLTIQLVSATILPPYEYRQYNNAQYYDIMFDGEGEATALTNLDIKNIYNYPLEEYKLEIPGNSRIVSVVQETSEGYKKLDYRKTSFSDFSVYYLKLNKKLNPDENTQILIFYKASGYVRENFGVYKFGFQTIKQDFDIDFTRVVVNVNEDLYLREGESSIRYVNNFLGYEKSLGASVLDSSMVKQYSNDIKYKQGYVKTTYNLDPLESFNVNGKYSNSWFNLYKFQIFLWTIIAAIIVVFLIRYTKWKNLKNILALNIISASLSSAISTSIIVFFSNSFMRYNSNDLLQLILGIILIVLISFSFLGPSVYIGTKKGFLSGLWTFIITCIILFLIMIFLTGYTSPMPLYAALD